MMICCLSITSTTAKPVLDRFAGDHKPGSRIVVLDPDIAEVFTTQESVNVVLRALIATMPKIARE